MEFWQDWKRKSKIEERAIKAIRRAKRLLLKEIGKENLFAIYIKGSFSEGK